MSIIQNKKAYHEYFIEDKYEAGIMLEGWEVKAIRAGRAQLKEAYVTVTVSYTHLHRRDRQKDQDEHAVRLDLRQLKCLAMRQQADRDASAIQRR